MPFIVKIWAGIPPVVMLVFTQFCSFWPSFSPSSIQNFAMFRDFSLEEKIFMVEEYARTPSLVHVRRKWPFSSDKPHVKTIAAIVKKWRETGSVGKKKGSGRKREVRTAEKLEEICTKIKKVRRSQLDAWHLRLVCLKLQP